MMTAENDRLTQERMSEIADETNAWSAQNQAEGGVCDFCLTLLSSLPERAVTYVLDRDITTVMAALDPDTLGVGSITYVQDPYWAACPACDAVIQQNDPALLARHVCETTDEERLGMPRDRIRFDEMRELYVRFYAADPKRVV